MPSCRSRSIRLRVSSAAATILAREAISSARLSAFAIAVATRSVNEARRASVSAGSGCSGLDRAVITPYRRPSDGRLADESRGSSSSSPEPGRRSGGGCRRDGRAGLLRATHKPHKSGNWRRSTRRKHEQGGIPRHTAVHLHDLRHTGNQLPVAKAAPTPPRSRPCSARHPSTPAPATSAPDPRRTPPSSNASSTVRHAALSCGWGSRSGGHRLLVSLCAGSREW
jgi:hypothetical protein